jgi:hypothetical protein
MKKELVLSVILTAIVFSAIGFFAGKDTFEPIKECHRKHINPMTDGRFMVVPVDTVDGRPTYNILFEDETGLDSMYPEEIANSLNSGKWEYNEMLEIKERQ